MNNEYERNNRLDTERVKTINSKNALRNDREVVKNKEWLVHARRDENFNGKPYNKSALGDNNSNSYGFSKTNLGSTSPLNYSNLLKNSINSNTPKSNVNNNFASSDLSNGGLNYEPDSQSSKTVSNENLNNKDISDNLKNNSEKKKAEAAVKTAVKVNPALDAVAKTPKGKKVIGDISNKIVEAQNKRSLFSPKSWFSSNRNNDSTSQESAKDGQYYIKGKGKAKTIAIVAIICCISSIILGFLCILAPLTQGEKGLMTLYLAQKIFNQQDADNTINNTIERLNNGDDSDSFFVNNDEDTQSNSNNSNSTSTESTPSNIIISAPKQTNNNSNGNGVGSFKGEIIYYYQYDYYDYPYSSFGSIASHGCGPTSLSIAISSILGKKHDPIELTDYVCYTMENGCFDSGSYYATIWDTAVNYGKEYGFTVEPTSDTELVKKKLSEGNSLVITVTNGGFYTNSGNMISSSGHYFVLTGVDENGQVYLSDPANPYNTGRTIDLDALSINNNNKPSAPSYCILTK